MSTELTVKTVTINFSQNKTTFRGCKPAIGLHFTRPRCKCLILRIKYKNRCNKALRKNFGGLHFQHFVFILHRRKHVAYNHILLSIIIILNTILQYK